MPVVLQASRLSFAAVATTVSSLGLLASAEAVVDAQAKPSALLRRKVPAVDKLKSLGALYFVCATLANSYNLYAAIAMACGGGGRALLLKLSLE